MFLLPQDIEAPLDRNAADDEDDFLSQEEAEQHALLQPQPAPRPGAEPELPPVASDPAFEHSGDLNSFFCCCLQLSLEVVVHFVCMAVLLNRRDNRMVPATSCDRRWWSFGHEQYPLLLLRPAGTWCMLDLNQ